MSKINCRMNGFCNSFQYHCRPFVDIHYFVYEIIVLYSIDMYIECNSQLFQ